MLETRVQVGIYADINDAINKSLDRELGVEGHPADVPAALKEDIKDQIMELDQLPEATPRGVAGSRPATATELKRKAPDRISGPGLWTLSRYRYYRVQRSLGVVPGRKPHDSAISVASGNPVARNCGS